MSTHELAVAGAGEETVRPTRRAPLAALAAMAHSARRYLAEPVRALVLRRLERELLALDDRMLRDIGLSRSQVGRAIRNGLEDGRTGG
jgi:uncharacterized protein YjiS (DUF1127 family)